MLRQPGSPLPCASLRCFTEGRLHRLDATRLVLNRVGDAPIVSNLGPTTDELWHAGHRDRNFYTYGAMGLCSSIALGMALSTSEKVVSLDGDGSLLMNMGTIATIGRELPPNLIVIVWDNEEWAQTGHQPQPHRHTHRPGASGPGLRHTQNADRLHGRRAGDGFQGGPRLRWALVHSCQDRRGGVPARGPHRAGNDPVPVPQDLR